MVKKHSYNPNAGEGGVNENEKKEIQVKSDALKKEFKELKKNKSLENIESIKNFISSVEDTIKLANEVKNTQSVKTLKNELEGLIKKANNLIDEINNLSKNTEEKNVDATPSEVIIENQDNSRVEEQSNDPIKKLIKVSLEMLKAKDEIKDIKLVRQAIMLIDKRLEEVQDGDDKILLESIKSDFEEILIKLDSLNNKDLEIETTNQVTEDPREEIVSKKHEKTLNERLDEFSSFEIFGISNIERLKKFITLCEGLKNEVSEIYAKKITQAIVDAKKRIDILSKPDESSDDFDFQQPQVSEESTEIKTEPETGQIEETSQEKDQKIENILYADIVSFRSINFKSGMSFEQLNEKIKNAGELLVRINGLNREKREKYMDDIIYISRIVEQVEPIAQMVGKKNLVNNSGDCVKIAEPIVIDMKEDKDTFVDCYVENEMHTDFKERTIFYNATVIKESFDPRFTYDKYFEANKNRNIQEEQQVIIEPTVESLQEPETKPQEEIVQENITPEVTPESQIISEPVIETPQENNENLEDYEEVENFEYGARLRNRKTNKYNIKLNNQNECLFETDFDVFNLNANEDGPFTKGEVMKVFNDGKYNFINKDGKLISQIWFDYIHSIGEENIFSEDGFLEVELNEKFNLINKQGILLLDEWVDGIYASNERDKVYLKDGKLRIKIGKNRKWINVDSGSKKSSFLERIMNRKKKEKIEESEDESEKEFVDDGIEYRKTLENIKAQKGNIEHIDFSNFTNLQEELGRDLELKHLFDSLLVMSVNRVKSEEVKDDEITNIINEISSKTGIDTPSLIDVFNTQIAITESRLMSDISAVERKKAYKKMGGYLTVAGAFTATSLLTGGIPVLGLLGYSAVLGVVRLADVYLSSKSREKTKEDKINELTAPSEADSNLYKSLISLVALKKKLQLDNITNIEPILESYIENAKEYENKTREEKDSIILSLKTLYDIDKSNSAFEERIRQEHTERDEKKDKFSKSWLGRKIESKLVKGAGNFLNGGSNDEEKMVSAATFASLGIAAREIPGLKQVLLGIAGWKFGGLAGKYIANKGSFDIGKEDTKGVKKLERKLDKALSKNKLSEEDHVEFTELKRKISEDINFKKENPTMYLHWKSYIDKYEERFLKQAEISNDKEKADTLVKTLDANFERRINGHKRYELSERIMIGGLKFLGAAIGIASGVRLEDSQHSREVIKSIEAKGNLSDKEIDAIFHDPKLIGNVKVAQALLNDHENLSGHMKDFIEKYPGIKDDNNTLEDLKNNCTSNAGEKAYLSKLIEYDVAQKSASTPPADSVLTQPAQADTTGTANLNTGATSPETTPASGNANIFKMSSAEIDKLPTVRSSVSETLHTDVPEGSKMTLITYDEAGKQIVHQNVDANLVGEGAKVFMDDKGHITLIDKNPIHASWYEHYIKHPDQVAKAIEAGKHEINKPSMPVDQPIIKTGGVATRELRLDELNKNIDNYETSIKETQQELSNLSDKMAETSISGEDRHEIDLLIKQVDGKTDQLINEQKFLDGAVLERDSLAKNDYEFLQNVKVGETVKNIPIVGVDKKIDLNVTNIQNNGNVIEGVSANGNSVRITLENGNANLEFIDSMPQSSGHDPIAPETFLESQHVKFDTENYVKFNHVSNGDYIENVFVGKYNYDGIDVSSVVANEVNGIETTHIYGTAIIDGHAYPVEVTTIDRDLSGGGLDEIKVQLNHEINAVDIFKDDNKIYFNGESFEKNYWQEILISKVPSSSVAQMRSVFNNIISHDNSLSRINITQDFFSINPTDKIKNVVNVFLDSNKDFQTKISELGSVLQENGQKINAGGMSFANIDGKIYYMPNNESAILLDGAGTANKITTYIHDAFDKYTRALPENK